MIVTKNTIDRIDNPEDFNKALYTIKEFGSTDFSKVDVIFTFKITGRRNLEFYIIGSTDEKVADLTNRIVVDKLSEFKWGTAKEFSKTLVKNWDKLYYEDDGSFKI